MPTATSSFESSPSPLAPLADFRFELRRFLRFSEEAALTVGLQTQQYQLLLQIAGTPQHVPCTIAHAADRLSLRHNTVVELVDRSVQQRLLDRLEDLSDRRRVLLRLTPQGRRILERLADAHAQELEDRAPRLIASLKKIGAGRQKSAPQPIRKVSR